MTTAKSYACGWFVLSVPPKALHEHCLPTAEIKTEVTGLKHMTFYKGCLTITRGISIAFRIYELPYFPYHAPTALLSYSLLCHHPLSDQFIYFFLSTSLFFHVRSFWNESLCIQSMHICFHNLCHICLGGFASQNYLNPFSSSAIYVEKSLNLMGLPPPPNLLSKMILVICSWDSSFFVSFPIDKRDSLLTSSLQ